MKVFAYALRAHDELAFMEECSRELGFEFGWTEDYPSLENVCLAEGYDALSIITNPMYPELLDALHAAGIKNLATRSIGYEHIDVAHAYGLGMRVAHASYPPEGVANYAIMMMMMALRRLKRIQREADEQNFDLRGKLARDISRCRVGIVGTGRIGATVARHLSGFGCEILAYDPYPRAELAGVVRYAELDELLAGCDVVSLHVLASAENRHMIGERELSLMREDAVLVNTARGSLVDSAALIAALKEGRIAGAALDTIENEAGLYYLDRRGDDLANPERDELLALENAIVTPHMAFYTEENVRDMVRTTVEALLDFEAGRESEHEVAH